MRELMNLKNLIFEMDNKACFIERDRILGQLEIEMAGYDQPDRICAIMMLCRVVYGLISDTFVIIFYLISGGKI